MPRRLAFHLVCRLLLLVLCVPAAGCRTFVPAPPGAPSTAVPAPPVATPRLTQPDGWAPPAAPEAPAVFTMDPGVRALADAVAQRGPVRALLYFNQRLSADPAAWRVARRHTATWDRTEASGTSRAEAHEALHLFVEEALPERSGAAALAPPLGLRLEEVATRALLRAGVTVVDVPVLFRQTARTQDLTTRRATEIAALAEGVDVLVEITFIHDPDAPDGYAVAVKAVQVADAALLATASSTTARPPEAAETVTYVAVEGGFAAEVHRPRVTLEDHARHVLNEVLLQWAQRYGRQ